MFADELVTPMGFFVLRKAGREGATAAARAESGTQPGKAVPVIGRWSSSLDPARTAVDHVLAAVGGPPVAQLDMLVVDATALFLSGIAASGKFPRRVVAAGPDAPPEVPVGLTFEHRPLDVGELVRASEHSDGLFVDPLGDDVFDVICALRTFLHLAPAAYATLLRYLRAHAHLAPNGRLFFTTYVDELTAGGRGLADGLARHLQSQSSGRRARVRTAVRARRKPVDFRELRPREGAPWALYSRPRVTSLVESTGWQLLELREPEPGFQHQVVCAPR
jgi:hypothetical protein